MGLWSQRRTQECHRGNEGSRGAGVWGRSRQGGKRKSGPLNEWHAVHLFALMGRAALA